MAKVILICGKMCSGKTTYAERLRSENKAVVFSVDEIMISLFGLYAGDKHDEYVERTKKYLLDKSVEVIEAGMDVILDWGFWTKEERISVKEFYVAHKIEHESHYIDISDEIWKMRLDKRNAAVSAGSASAYFVDKNLATKFESRFEMPERDEIDVWVKD